MQTIRTTAFTRWLRRAAFVVAAAALAACGGGGGGDSGSNSSSAGGGSTNVPQSAVANAVTVTVNSGVQRVSNIPTVSVTVCAPGTGTCQTVTNVQVDTESFGLRVLASALPSSVIGALPVGSGGNGGTLTECGQFADGYTWGSIRTADVKIGGETASAIPIQVIGDMAASSVPQACQNIGNAHDTQSDLGANGILGIGVAPVDCGATCVQNVAKSPYYGCPSGTNCSRSTVPLAQQVANPVAHFVTDNNGVILQLPQIGAGGESSVSGTLWFGIGTQSNNALNAAQRFASDSGGNLTATFNGASLQGFLDSGSNGLFFSDGSLTQCTGDFAGYYCPSSQQTLSATLTGIDGQGGSVSFNVGNASTLFNSGNFAFDNLAGDFAPTGMFDLGLPFFFGRTVYYGLDQQASGGPAPFVAF